MPLRNRVFCNIVLEMDPRIFLRKHQNDILFVSVLAICITLNNILHETEIELPSISLHITGYMICFGISYGFLRGYHIITETEPEQWESIKDASCAWRVTLLAFVMASSIVCRTLARERVKTAGIALSLEVWRSHIPFWVAVFSRSLVPEKLVYSVGTSLGSTCGLIMMLPFEDISKNLESHIFAVLHTILTALSVFLIFEILNTYDKSKIKGLTPFHIMLHVSALIPLFLLLAVGFVEGSTLVDFVDNFSWIMLGQTLLHGLFLFLGSFCTISIFQNRSLFVGTIAYCFGTCLTILLVFGASTLVGFCMVLLTVFVHLFIVHRVENTA
jgi:hypothetical protein